MYKFLAVILLSLSFSLQAAEVPGAHAAPNAAGGDASQNLSSMVGGGLFGMLLASGAVGLISATTMMLEGTGVAEALEAGAGMPLPLAALSAILGGVFAQEFVKKQMDSLNLGGENKAPTAH